MRCTCCNRNLNDFELTRKYASTGEYADMCNRCSEDLDIAFITRDDLSPFEQTEDDEFEIEDDD